MKTVLRILFLLLLSCSNVWAQSGPWANSSAKLKGDALVRDSSGGYLAEVQSIVQGGGDVNWTLDGGLTPLLAAASGGHLEIVKFLLDKGKKRLFGYASWKAEIILSYLNKIPENSILQYSDIGCVFNPNGLARLKEYIQITDKKNILAFKYTNPNFNIKEKYKFQIHYENQYTKADAWKYFDIDDSSDFLKTEQIWSGTIFFKKNIYVKEILNNWKKACSVNSLIDDSSSIKKNHPNFIEHRHDQSMFSLICKKENIFCLSASECEWAEFENKRIWSHLKNYPVLAKRDKKFNFIKRFINRQKKNIARFLKK